MAEHEHQKLGLPGAEILGIGGLQRELSKIRLFVVFEVRCGYRLNTRKLTGLRRA